MKALFFGSSLEILNVKKNLQIFWPAFAETRRVIPTALGLQ